MQALMELGWSEFFEAQLRPEDGVGKKARVGRIAVDRAFAFKVLERADEWGQGKAGGVWAEAAGRLKHHAASKSELPAVGDFVVFQPAATEASRAVVKRVLKRKSAFIRRAAGERGGDQVIAANVDTTFVMMSMNVDFNLRRLERYLSLVRESGAAGAVLLTKADLCQNEGGEEAMEEAREMAAAARAVAGESPVHVISAVTGAGLGALQGYLGAGKTVALVGSSGVGKSTLANALLGREVMFTLPVSEDDTGSHTTSSRFLMRLPGGGWVMDTPGMRALGAAEEREAAGEESSLGDTFEDVAALALGCKYPRCRHEREPGCAVRPAVEAGTLDPARVAHYLKLQAEQEAARSRAFERVKAADKLPRKTKKEKPFRWK